VKGQFVPASGPTVQISRREMLDSVTGPFDLKLSLQGSPRPLLLKLHRESTFTDLYSLAGQAFRFTALSWRRPYPSSKPVTILYSDLIAGLLGQLEAGHQLELRHDLHQAALEQVVPMNLPAPRMAGDPVRYLGGQISALPQRIATANAPGNLDGLLARNILDPSPGFARSVDPISCSWLKDNADRLEGNQRARSARIRPRRTVVSRSRDQATAPRRAAATPATRPVPRRQAQLPTRHPHPARHLPSR
jgi:hypothetical protein